MTREGVDANIARAEDIGIKVAELGAMPVIPHANTSRPDFEHVQPYPFWIAGTLALLRRCDAMILTAYWEKSFGARGEKAEAELLGIPVFFTVDALRAWLAGES